MYRLKPPLTFATWGLVVGVAMLLIGTPSFLARGVDTTRLEMVELGNVDLGYPCEYSDEQVSTHYQCADTILDTLEVEYHDNPERSLRRIARALMVEAEGEPEQLEDNDRVWLLKLSDGVMVGEIEDADLMQITTIRGPDYKIHLSEFLQRVEKDA